MYFFPIGIRKESLKEIYSLEKKILLSEDNKETQDYGKHVTVKY